MLKKRTIRRLLGGGIVTVGMLAMALPAHAGSASVTDASGDTLDPILTQNDATKFTTPTPSTDITSYSLSSSGRNLTATITVAGTIPAEGSTDPLAFQGARATGLADTGQEYPTYVGGSYHVMYADTATEKNTYNLAPACTGLAGQPVYDFQEHWLDGYRHWIGVSVTWDGTKWNYSPQIGDFDPTASGGFGFYDLKSEPLMEGKFSYARTSANTITVTVNTNLTIPDETCQEGFLSFDYGNTGHTINAVTAYNTIDQIAVLPVALPTSVVPGESDIQAVGGLVSASDWANSAGFGLGTAGSYSEEGPACPTPTVGGTLPRNPLFVDGAPCNIQNPLPGGGAGFRNSGTSFVF